ncbi:MAG: cell division protein FtsW [Treponema sp.]|jgi:cell division protein FtsW|nr:cell division protein FtsW [Treponema sp.]
MFHAARPVEKYHKSDILFMMMVLLLWGLGLFTLFVCTPEKGERLFNNRYYFVIRQLVWSVVGFASLAFFAMIPIRVLRKLLPFIVLGSLLLCIIAIVPSLGSMRKGASRWISLSRYWTVQPSEFAKFAVILFLSNLFDKQAREDGGTQKEFYYPLIGLFIFVITIFLQKDFSTGVFMFIVGCLMFFVSGARMSWFGPLVLLAIPTVAFMIAIEPFRLMRVISFLNPDEYSLTTNYQILASQRAITAGGFWGNGLGSSFSDVYKIPEVQTDYIFAGWADSMGLLGVAAYFCALLFFAWRGYRTALLCRDRFAAYAAFGCISMIFIQSLMNCAVVCGAVPTTGITLPFFSSGGSSLVVTLSMCGFVINASRCDTDDDGRAVPSGAAGREI